MILLSCFADNQSGHGLLLWLFTLISVALLLVMHMTAVSWFYSFMAIFYLLGCWFKVMVHHIIDYPYVEPVGNFSNLPSQWQDYYIFAIAIGSALLLGRLISLPILNLRCQLEQGYCYKSGPVSALQWLILTILAFVFYTFNNRFGFFVTGVNPSLTLPLGLNAPVAFMSLVGMPLILSIFVARDIQARGRLKLGPTLAVLLVGSIASVSMASRAALVMQSLPILLAAFYLQLHRGVYRFSYAPVVLFMVFALLVLAGVSIYRIETYKLGGYADSDLVIKSLLQSAMLIIDRWVGAEAIMVAVSSHEQSLSLLGQLLVESPTTGVYAIYQQLSGGKYQFQEGFTFLTLPGYFGVFSLAGNAVMLAALVLAMTLLGLCYELFTKKLLMNQTIPVAVVCAALANAFSQMAFPLLLLPFVFQMTVFAALLGSYMRRSMGLCDNVALQKGWQQLNDITHKKSDCAKRNQ